MRILEIVIQYKTHRLIEGLELPLVNRCATMPHSNTNEYLLSSKDKLYYDDTSGACWIHPH